MPYDSDTDPYLDPITGILKNSLGITKQVELDKAEADLTSAVLLALPENPILGNFDLKHLQDLHKTLFSSLYSWAGELRTVEMAKGSTSFANPEFLEQAAKNLFDGLQAEKLLGGLGDEAYARRLAHYFSEINILHPFREGNGRTQRAFFTLLVVQSDRQIAWERMDPDENIAASIEAYNGDESRLAAMLFKLLQ